MVPANDQQLLNILLVLFIFVQSQVDTSMEVNPDPSAHDAKEILLVLFNIQFEQFIEVNESQDANIAWKLVQLLKSQPLQLMLVKPQL